MTGLLQRKCACGGPSGLTGEYEESRNKRLSLQRRSTNHLDPSMVPPIVHEVLRSPGQPLDSATRAFMEPRFGHDFSRVRVHADARAAESALTVDARAYTVGGHVVFAEGRYAPRTEAGRRLLAHELTHVIQQDGRAPAPGACLMIGPADSVLERQADGTAKAVEDCPGREAGRPAVPPGVQAHVSPMLQRAIRFSSKTPLAINHWDAGTTAIHGDTAEIVNGDYEAQTEVHVEADTAAELANWEVGFLQNAQVTWNRTYWSRDNTDRRGRFLERKLRVPASPLRDHLNDAIVWAAPGEFADVPASAGAALSTDITVTTSDAPTDRRNIHGSNMGDASDGSDNIFQHRKGWNFVSFVSAHNSATDEWRHLELIYWSVQASVDFATEPAGGVRVTRDDRQLGRSRRFRWSPAADPPVIGATRANAYINEPGNVSIRRVEGWT